MARAALPRIEKATALGFCFGVKRAVQLMKEAARKRGEIFSLGEAVHNPRVVARLRQEGVKIIGGLEEIAKGAVGIPSHGAGPEVYEQARKQSLEIVDATCPYVRGAQKAARKMAGGGFWVVIFGEREHAEVKGILAWAGEKAIATLEVPTFPQPPRRLGLLAQTTQPSHRFAAFVREILNRYWGEVLEFRIVDTICGATVERQEAVLSLAEKADLILVVGGRNSANTRRLAELASGKGVETYLIEETKEIEPSWLKGKNHIGVTAGASTPDEAVEEVLQRLKELTQRG